MKKKKTNNFLKDNILVILIVLISFLLRIYEIESQMMFIGDFAWFYIAARDLLVTHDIPLVSITTSQTWLHQGPYWTYILAIVLKLFSFSPVSGGYLAAGIGALTVLVMYWTGLEFFSKKVGIICAFLFATSPLIVIFSRMPYHTTPIPLFTALLILYTYRWLNQGPRYVPHVLLFCAVLYNFELATFSIIPVIGVLFLYGLVKKRKYIGIFKSKRIIFYSIIALIVPLFPILMYDFRNGFLQTLKFLHWTIFLRILKPIFEGNGSNIDLVKSLDFFFQEFHRTIFMENAIIAILILLFILSIVIYRVAKDRKTTLSEAVILLFFGIPFVAFFLNGTLSEAYIPVLFPPVILITAFYLHSFSMNLNKEKVFFVAIFLLGIMNTYSVLKNNFLIGQPGGYGVPLSIREEAARKIISLGGTSKVSIIAENGGNGYESFTMPYEYLVWLYGGNVVRNGNPIFVSEVGNSVLIKQENKTYEITK